LRNNRRTFALTVAAAAALVVPVYTEAQQAPAQQQPAPAIQASVSTPAIAVKPVRPKLDRYKGRVLAFNIATIIVQSMDNQRMVWSFQYSTDLRSRVADMLSTGGFQPGDKVEVYCNPGTTVAVRLKGKPSKSS